MTSRRLIALAALLAASSLLWTGSASAENRYALLIGISDYSASGFSDLQGPANDLALMRPLVETLMRVPAANITELHDEAASHSGVRRAFEDLADKLRNGDFVYIHYSGHGSFTADLNGDERAGEDQTWVTWGSRGSASDSTAAVDAYDVLDDELNEWIDRLSARAGQIVLVSDSCHSASVTRGAPMPVRAAPGDDRRHPLGEESFATRGSVTTGKVLRIGSARDVQSAAEFRAPDGKPYGLFTWHWAATLAERAGNGTWEDHFQTVAARVRAERGEFQVPQMEGNGGALIGSGTSAGPAVVVTEVLADDRVQLSTGVLTGATVGSVYAPLTGAADLRVTIDRTDTRHSEGVVTAGTLEVGDLLTEVEHQYRFEPLRVFLADHRSNANGAETEAIRSTVEAQPNFELVSSQTEADYVLALLRPKAGHTGTGLPETDAARPLELWITTAHEELLSERLRMNFENLDRGRTTLAGNLRRIARLREFRALGNRSSRAHGQVRVAAIRYASVEAADCEFEDCIDLGDLGLFIEEGPFEPDRLARDGVFLGDLVTFEIRNDGRRDVWVYLVNATPGGEIAALFPEPGSSADAALVPPGRSVNLFEEGLALLPEEAGEEFVKVIIARQPINATLLAQTGFEGTRGSANPLERLLAGALQGTRAVVRISNDSWATRDITFPVSR